MGTARITTIAGEIKTLIDAMTTTGGYNFNWPAPNETDKALNTAWPASFIRYNSEKAAEETIAALYGFQTAEITIEVEYKITPSTTTKPEFTADASLDNCLADLRKLFRQNNTNGYLPLSGEAVMTFVSSEKITNTRDSTYRPVKLVTKWSVFYHNS